MGDGPTDARSIVTIGREIIAQVHAEAAAAPDREICGLLFGTEAAIVMARATANVAADPARSFEIDPQALIAAHRAMRGGDATLAGCYHSHPSGDATPSERDRAAAEPGALWLIVGGGKARLWKATPEDFVPIPYAVMPELIRHPEPRVPTCLAPDPGSSLG